MKIYDPYDIWSLPTLGKLKTSWTQGKKAAAWLVPVVGMVELWIPNALRAIIGVKPHQFAHVEAMRYQMGVLAASDALDVFREAKAVGGGWGLPFAWYSKNGAYSARTPYVTNTPYVMEALLQIRGESEFAALAIELFEDTRSFIDSLEIKHYTDNELALSYAPVQEPREVINANSYSALAYALHANNGSESRRNEAFDRAKRLVNWVLSQQKSDGSWFYYADSDQGNFIDCFHSCFIVKNLIKVRTQLPELAEKINPSVELGWKYIRENLYDSKHHLCRRFSQRSHLDPFRWDIYDQAEYLGLLIDFGLYDEAHHFANRVENLFTKNGSWYCRIDILGRLWGKGFARWGIIPFQYHQNRLMALTRGEA